MISEHSNEVTIIFGIFYSVTLLLVFARLIYLEYIKMPAHLMVGEILVICGIFSLNILLLFLGKYIYLEYIDILPYSKVNDILIIFVGFCAVILLLIFARYRYFEYIEIPPYSTVTNSYQGIVDYQLTVKTAIQNKDLKIFEWCNLHPKNLHSKEILTELQKQK